MVETGAITKDQAERAKAEPLHLSTASVDASEAPYFVDLVHDQLLQKIGERDFNLRRPAHLHLARSRSAARRHRRGRLHHSRCRRAGGEAARAATKKARRQPYAITYPQVALVALNPHTGQVLALVGGRSYGNSQVNHAVAHRPTGSIFKPFVYAAAFQTAVEGTPLPGPGQAVLAGDHAERRADHLHGRRQGVQPAQLSQATITTR